MTHLPHVYVCFDVKTDIAAFEMMCDWKLKGMIRFDFDHGYGNTIDPDPALEYQIRRQIRNKLKNRILFLVLVGEHSHAPSRFNQWEMEEAIKMDMPILAANLNGLRKQDDKRCPPVFFDRAVMHISFKPKILQFATGDWPAFYQSLAPENKEAPFLYGPEAYLQ